MARRFTLIVGWMLPVVIAVLFMVMGPRFDPAYFLPPSGTEHALPVPPSIAGWTLQDGQKLPADRMFEKINGKADYYLQYGAVELITGEWTWNEQRWDMYLYRFEDDRGARGAYTGERPAVGEPISAVDGYRVPGQTAAALGAYYLQLNAQQAAADPVAAIELLLALAPVLNPEDSERIIGIDLPSLIPDLMTAGSEEFFPENAFGFSSLSQVQSVSVSLAGTEAVWFTAPGGPDTVKAYAEELALYGGEDLFTLEDGAGGMMFGIWALVQAADGAVWGINGAPSRSALMTHWDTLRVRILSEGEVPHE